MSYTLAIDQSTSATKALLFDHDLSVVDSEALPHEQHYSQPGWVEHDAAEIWRNTCAVVRTLAERNRPALRDLAHLCLTNQRETIVVFDRATGAPLAPAIVWQCRRSDAICEELRTAGHADLIRDSTGLRLDSYFSGPKLLWLSRERPEIAKRLRDGSALVGTIDAYLLYRLTGGKVFATDSTNASRTLLMDVARRAWDPALCELFSVPIAALPEIRDSFVSFGETTCAGVLPSPVPIVGVMGDSQASLFAQQCLEPGQAKATLGTGTSLLVNLGSAYRPPTHGAVVALAWSHNGQPTYAAEGIISYSAATLAWLRDQLGLIHKDDDIEVLAASVPDSGGVHLIPAFAGLSAPHWRPMARGAIVGLSAHTHKAHVVRAALESIAFQIHDALAMIAAEFGVTPQVLRVDGGPTQNGLLMHQLADLTGVPLEIGASPESSALGVAMAARIGCGEAKLKSLARAPRERRCIEPQITTTERERRHGNWKTALQRVL